MFYQKYNVAMLGKSMSLFVVSQFKESDFSIAYMSK